MEAMGVAAIADLRCGKTGRVVYEPYKVGEGGSSRMVAMQHICDVQRVLNYCFWQ